MAKSSNLKKFIGTFVEIVMDAYITASNETDQGKYEKKHPMIISGYMLDFDKEFVYIGTDADRLSDAVKREKIIQIGTSTPYDKYEKVLDEAETPDDEGFN